MGWRDNLPPNASFRGVPFHVVGAMRAQVGRRTINHAYPQRDDPYIEDNGLAPRLFVVPAVVVGDDYQDRRQALSDALDKAGAGELVHPRYGRMQVKVEGPVWIDETTDAGGKATFSINFVRDAANVQPAARSDTGNAVRDRAASARIAVTDDFTRRYSQERQPGFVQSAALGVMSRLQGEIDAARKAITPDLDVLPEYMRSAGSIRNSTANLIRLPADLVGGLRSMLEGMRGIATPPGSAIDGLRKLFGAGKREQSVPTTTPARQVQASNQAAMIETTQRLALIEAAHASSETEFDSFDQAMALRAELADQLEAQTETASDDVCQALTDLRVAVVKDLATRGGSLSRIAHQSLPVTMPAIVAAHFIFGDATRESELIARNPSITHPGFVPGGVDLEFLVDA